MSRLLRALPWLLAIALVLWIISTVSWTETAAALRNLNGWELLALAAANALVLVAIAGRWWLLLVAQGHRLPFRRVFGFRLAAFGLSYFTPGPHVGGEPLQVILVEREGVPRPDALAAVALDKALEFAVNFTFLLVGLLFILRWRIVPAESGRQAIGGAAVLLALPLAYLLASGWGRSPLGWLFERLGRLPPMSLSLRWRNTMASFARAAAAGETQIAALFREAPLYLVAALALSVVGWLLMLVEYWLMVAFLGVRMDFRQLITTLTAARVAILLLLPAGLGALEASQTVAFSAVGLNPSVGLAASLLIRARDTALAAVGLWWGTRQVRLGSEPEGDVTEGAS